VTLPDRTFELKSLLRAEDPSRKPWLVFSGRQLTLKAAKGASHRPILRLEYAAVGELVQNALTVKGGTVTLEGLRFELDARGAHILMAAVAREDGSVIIRDCDFVQLPRDPGSGLLSSVRVNATAATARANMCTLENCCFVTGQDAVTLTGPAEVKASKCLFGRHAALFHHQGERSGVASLNLRDCLAFLTDGPAFYLDHDAGCRIDAQECIFSRPETLPEAGTGAGVLVLQTGEGLPDWRYVGEHNYYHNLEAFWEQTGAPGNPAPLLSLDAFKKEKAGPVEKEQFSIELQDVSPWQSETPLKLLETSPRDAFVVNRARLPYFKDRKPTEVARRTLTVDPEVTQPGPGVYRDLSQAVLDSRPGDVIEIRAAGEVRVAPVRLDKSGVDLTVRAAKDYHPILTLGETPDSDVALFRIHDGQLRLEGLEFRLRPRQRPAAGGQKESQAVVAVGDVGQCTFKQCVITLAPEEVQEARFAAVTLVNPKDVMRTVLPGARTQPEVRLDACFVRGKGDLVSVPVSRPFDFEAKQSLIALTGSLFAVAGKTEDQSAAPPSSIRLAQVTTYLSEHLALLRANTDDARSRGGLVPTEISAEGCLFVSARGRSLVHLEGLDSEELVKRAFAWKGGGRNAYSGFTDLLDQQPKDPDSNRMMPVREDKWPEFAHEMAPGPLFLKLKWTVAADLSRSVPNDFKAKGDDVQGYGVDLGQLPRPTVTVAVGPVAPAED
jgi:hypothetical protein